MRYIILFLASTIISLLPLNSEGQCTGTYDNGYGKIHFEQIGNSVTATYDAPGSPGKFFGTLNGNTLSGTWTHEQRRGKIRFDFSHDFSSFEAFWGENDEPLTTAWGRSVRINTPPKTVNCINLYHLGLLMGNLEMGAYEGYNSDWMTRTIDYALDHIRASNCIDNSYLLDLKNRIQGYTNTNSFLNEIRDYKARLLREIETSCSCCLSCTQ